MQQSFQSDQFPAYCLVSCGQDCIEGLYKYGFIISCVFSILAGIVSLYNVIMHFINFNNPFFQSKIITIMFMPIVYCIPSTLSFFNLQSATYLTVMRDTYQVFGLFAFVYLIFSYLAYDHQKNQINQRKVYQIIISQSSQVPHDFPCSSFQKPYQLSNWIKAKYFSHRCKRAVLQYVIVKILTSLFLMLIYPNYELRPRKSDDWDYVLYGYVNIAIYWISTISCYIAYYYLGLFYNCLQKPLQPFKPDLKFTCFNMIMFFTYWQKVWMVIFQNDIIACFDDGAQSFHRRKIMYAIQHTLICIQMLVMVVASLQAYNYQSYQLRTVKNFGSVSYILKDMLNIFLHELRLIKPKKMGFKSQNDKSQTQLLTITGSANKKNEFHYTKNIRVPISQIIKQNYF